MASKMTDREVKDEILLLLAECPDAAEKPSPLDTRHELVIDDERATRVVGDMIDEDLVQEGAGSGDHTVYLSGLRPKGEDLKPKGVNRSTELKLSAALEPLEQIADRLGLSYTMVVASIGGGIGFLFGLVL